MYLMRHDVAVHTGGAAWGARLLPEPACSGRPVITAFADALRAPTGRSLQQLRAVTISFAHCMRTCGIAPEKGVIALKAMIADAGPPGWRPSLARVPGTPFPLEATLYASVFRAWVEAFFDDVLANHPA